MKMFRTVFMLPLHMVAGAMLMGACIAPDDPDADGEDQSDDLATVESDLTAPTACGVIRANQGLRLGQSLKSCDGRYTLVMQKADGNLVLYDRSVAIFASGTARRGVSYAIMQANGNLVLRSSAGAPIWWTDTGGHPGAYAYVGRGDLVIFPAPQAFPSWSAHGTKCCQTHSSGGITWEDCLYFPFARQCGPWENTRPFPFGGHKTPF